MIITNKDIVLSSIKEKIYEPISKYDIAISAQEQFGEFMAERANGDKICDVINYYEDEASMLKGMTIHNIRTYQIFIYLCFGFASAKVRYILIHTIKNV